MGLSQARYVFAIFTSLSIVSHCCRVDDDEVSCNIGSIFSEISKVAGASTRGLNKDPLVSAAISREMLETVTELEQFVKDIDDPLHNELGRGWQASRIRDLYSSVLPVIQSYGQKDTNNITETYLEGLKEVALKLASGYSEAQM